MPKFFVENSQIRENEITITGQDINHIRKVLRLKVDSQITVCNKDTGTNYHCSIKAIEKEKIICTILGQSDDTTEPSTYIHIFQGLPKADKLAWVIEKATEIGVKEMTPVEMQRTVVKLDDKTKEKKRQRWSTIAETASKQSGRDAILKVNNVRNFKNIVENLEEYDIVIVAYEKEQHTTLKQGLHAVDKGARIAVVIGPEGGIAEEEIEMLQQKNNVSIVTLGKRILRTETAPLVIASNILYELEE